MNAIEINGLSYRYPSGQLALDAVQCEIKSGERVALIGPNGAGKSTLLLHLIGLLPEKLVVTNRPITIANMPLIPNNLTEIRANVGMLFQDPEDQIFCPTVGEDVGFGPQQILTNAAEIASRVTAALATVGLSGYEQRAPHLLSGGEKRRVCIAGVLACEAQILVLDEPSSSLDPRSRREIIKLLQSLPQTQLIATHDLELVCELCTRVLLLDHGMIIATGSPQTMLADEQLMTSHGLEVPYSLRNTSW